MIKPAKAFLMVLAVEAILSRADLSQIPGMLALTEIIGNYIPVVSHFLSNPSISRNVPVYIAITLLLLPLKIYFAYKIIATLTQKSKLEVSRHNGASSRASLFSKSEVACFPSSEASFFKKIRSTIYVIFLNIIVIWSTFSLYVYTEYLRHGNALRSSKDIYKLIYSSGTGMWFGWSVWNLIPVALAMGLLLAFFVEWINFLTVRKIMRSK